MGKFRNTATKTVASYTDTKVHEARDSQTKLDVATAQTNLTTAQADLATTNANLATTNSNLATTNSNLATVNSMALEIEEYGQATRNQMNASSNKQLALQLKDSLTTAQHETINAFIAAHGSSDVRVNLPIYNYNCRPVMNPDGTLNPNKLCGASIDYLEMMSIITGIDVTLRLSPYPGWNGWDKSSLLRGEYDPDVDSHIMYSWTSSIPRQLGNKHVKASEHNVDPAFQSMVYNLAMEELVLDIMGLSHTDLVQRLATDINNGTIDTSRHTDTNAIIAATPSYPTDIIHPQTVNFIALFMYGFVLATCSCAAFDDLVYSANLLGVEISKDSSFVYYFQSLTEKQEDGDNGNPPQVDFSQQWYEQVIRDTMALALCLDRNICGAYIDGTYSLPTADPTITLADKKTISFGGSLFTNTGENTIYVPSGYPHQNELLAVLEIMEEFNLLQYLTTKYNAIYDKANIIANDLANDGYTELQKLAASTHRDITNLIMSNGTNNDPGSNQVTSFISAEVLDAIYKLYNNGIPLENGANVSGVPIAYVAGGSSDTAATIFGINVGSYKLNDHVHAYDLPVNAFNPDLSVKLNQTTDKVGQVETDLKNSFEHSIRSVFTKTELAKFDELRSKNIILTSSDYTYPLGNKMSWLWRGTHGKFSGFCTQVALLLSELTGVQFQFDYTGLDGSGYPPNGYNFFADPKADVGLFWVSTNERLKLGSAISIRKDLPTPVKVVTHTSNIDAFTTNLLNATLDTLAQFLHLDALGYTLVKPPDGEFSPFEDIEVWLADPLNTPQQPPIIITGEQFNQGTYTLNPNEYLFYKILPAFPNGVESSRNFSLQVSDISIFIKNGTLHQAEITECFEIIMRSGLTNSLGYVTGYQDASLEENGLIPDEAARAWRTVPDTVGKIDATYTPVVLSKDNVLTNVASMRGIPDQLGHDSLEATKLSWFQNYHLYGGVLDPSAPVYFKYVDDLICGLNDDETSADTYKLYHTPRFNKIIYNLYANSTF